MQRIVTEGLSKRYGDVLAVDALDLRAGDGEIVGFLGRNGAGKSTTIKMLVGLVRPTSGRALVNGVDVQADGVEARRGLGYLPEVVALYENMTGRQFLHFASRFFRFTESQLVHRTEELLDQVGLQHAAGRRIRTYSKGMRQRLGLAGAMVHDPDVLVLDEPLTGLDPPVAIGMREAVRRLGKEKTVLISSHELHAVEALCDRVVLVDQGRVLADAPLDELCGAGRLTIRIEPAGGSPSAADSMAADPGAVDRPDAGRPDAEVLHAHPDLGDVESAGHVHHARLRDGAAAADVLADLVRQGVRVADFHHERESLEAAFLRLTEGRP